MNTSLEQALVKRIEIDKTEFEIFRKVHPRINMDSRVFVTGYPDDAPDYQILRLSSFAIPKVHTRASSTVVLTVYYEEIYKKENTEAGLSLRWYELHDYKPSAYFKQDMLVFSPSFNPIHDIKKHYGGILHIAMPYYKHTS
jgi:hypothetical protein